MRNFIKKWLLKYKTQEQPIIDTKDNDLGTLGNLDLELFNSSPIPSVLLDASLSVFKYNRAFIDMLGNKKYEMLGWNFLQIIKKPYQDSFNNFVSQLETSTKPLEIKIIGKNKLTVCVFLTKLFYKSNLSIFLQIIDITDQRRFETNNIHAQKLQALGQLAGGIAHDFNNLLTAMLGFCDLLLNKHKEGDSSYTGIMQIKSNVDRAISLVRQLLGFSRKQAFHPQSININVVIAELSQLINRLIEDNITLVMKYKKNIKAIKFDKGHLEQIIINLSVNARDAMLKGGTLTITTDTISHSELLYLHRTLITPCEFDSSDKNDFVLITFEDTGSGIPKKYINKIFDPFFSTKKIGTGTGLGLSTVYGLIKQAGGYLFFETKENVGTKFYVLLKSHEKNQLVHKELKKEVKEDIPDVTLLPANKTIVLVEDEEGVRTICKLALESQGYHVVEYNNGLQAIEYMKLNNQVDLIITDLLMPAISGEELIANIELYKPNIEVILISGYDDHPLLQNLKSKKNIYFLSKPFSVKELLSKVGKIL